MTIETWISLPQVAAATGTSPQYLRKLVLKSRDGSFEFRDSKLIVRKIRSVGGRSGTSYQVRADSLTVGLQLALKEHQRPIEGPLNHGSKAQRERRFWDNILSPIVGLPARSRQRGAAIKEIASRRHSGPEGELLKYSAKTVRRWLDKLERQGLSGLGRRKRRDAGKKIAIVSREFDKAAKAVGLSDEWLQEIAADIRNYIRSFIGKHAERVVIRKPATLRLNSIAQHHGFGRIDNPFRISEHLIQREKLYRKIAVHDRDQKRFVDNQGRVFRTIDGMLPMQLVVGDVHPVDIHYCRPDGSIATARLIGWVDVATKRFFGTIVFCDAGRSITNADVIQSFLDMVAAWGVPQFLYLDNGSEYNFADYIEPGLRLLADRFPELYGRTCTIIRALPRNAPAKPIEGVFGIIEKYLRDIFGHVGGDRMKKKVSNIHKMVDIYQGSNGMLVADLQARFALYNSNQQHKRSQLKGKSPNEAYAAAIESGWTMTVADPMAFQIAFSKEVERTVRQGYIEWKGRKWTCPELQRYHGDKVNVLEPQYYSHGDRIPVMKIGEREPFAYVEPVKLYPYLDPEGAKESARIKRRGIEGIRQLKRDVEPIDIQQEINNVVRLEFVPVAPVGATLGASDAAKRIIANVREPAHERQEREAHERQEAASKQLKLIEKYLSKSGGAS